MLRQLLCQPRAVPVALCLLRHIPAFLREPQANAVDTMPLISRRRVPLSLEYMPQMPATIATQYLRSRHAESPIRVSRHRAGDTIEICRPSASGLELVRGFVQRSVAGGAGVGARGGHVFVIGPGVGGFRAFLTEDAELFCDRSMLDEMMGNR